MVSTWELMKQRRAADSKPGQRNDPYHLRATFEAGGMAGCNNGALVALLEENGFTPDLFDSMDGCSAGSHVMAHYAAGSARMGSTLFPRDLAHKRFINPWRLGWGRALDLKHLVWRRFADPQGEWFLDASALADAPIPLRFLASDTHGNPVWLPLNGQPAHRIYHACELTAQVPMVSHPWWERKTHWDGMLVGSIPWPSTTGCKTPCPTHWLVLRTRPVDAWHMTPSSRAERLVLGNATRVLHPKAARILERRTSHGDSSHLAIKARVDAADPTVLVLGAADSTVANATTDPHAIWGAMANTYRLAAAILGLDDTLPNVWQRHMPADLQ